MAAKWEYRESETFYTPIKIGQNLFHSPPTIFLKQWTLFGPPFSMVKTFFCWGKASQEVCAEISDKFLKGS